MYLDSEGKLALPKPPPRPLYIGPILSPKKRVARELPMRTILAPNPSPGSLPVLGFNHCVQTAFKVVNQRKASRKTGRRIADVIITNAAIWTTFSTKASIKGLETSFETKIYALSALRDIDIVIVGGAPSQLASDTRNGDMPEKIMALMSLVVESMTGDEKQGLVGDENWLRDMAEMKKGGRLLVCEGDGE